MRISTVLSAAVLTAALAMPAHASDPVYNWSGLYVGGHVGWATGDWDGRLSTTAGDQPNPDASYSDPYRTLDGDGWLGGAQFGYNIQLRSLVVGAEVDFSWSEFGGSASYATDQDGPSIWDKRHDMRLEHFGTARVRFGYAVGRIMPFITGGIAWGKANADLGVAYFANGTDYKGTSRASTSEDHFGWTAGAGVEWLMLPNWTMKAEWLHVDLGREDYHYEGTTYFDTPFNTDSFPSDLTFDVFRLGVNYKFGN